MLKRVYVPEDVLKPFMFGWAARAMGSVRRRRPLSCTADPAQAVLGMWTKDGCSHFADLSGSATDPAHPRRTYAPARPLGTSRSTADRPLIGTSPATADTGENLVPVHKSDRAVPGQYIVTLGAGMAPTAMAEKLGVSTLFTYGKVLHGFAAELTPAQLEAVRGYSGVETVEENSVAGAIPVQSAAAAGRAPASSWGLDRIDQRNLPLDGEFNVSGTGAGVTAYIVDTGIDAAHSEFAGRLGSGFDGIGDGRNGQDCNGHGTHVAGTVAGATYGVARSASLVPVRVLDCEGTGSWAGIIAGLDWIAGHAESPAVVNASLGGPSSAAVDSAFDSLRDQGILPVVAAGNENQDACNVSRRVPAVWWPWRRRRPGPADHIQ
ncbi:S8 family peptidase [Streptomyces sp. M10(2022)]